MRYAAAGIFNDGENMLVVNFFVTTTLAVIMYCYHKHKYSCGAFFRQKNLTLIGQINFVGAESNISFD